MKAEKSAKIASIISLVSFLTIGMTFLINAITNKSRVVPLLASIWIALIVIVILSGILVIIQTVREKQKEKDMSIAQNREDGGRLVREAWVYWAKKQPDAKPSWLLSWDELPERDKEADRVIWDEIVAPYATMIRDLVDTNSQLNNTLHRLYHPTH